MNTGKMTDEDYIEWSQRDWTLGEAVHVSQGVKPPSAPDVAPLELVKKFENSGIRRAIIDFVVLEVGPLPPSGRSQKVIERQYVLRYEHEPVIGSSLTPHAPADWIKWFRARGAPVSLDWQPFRWSPAGHQPSTGNGL